MLHLDAFASIALDLTASFASEDRYRRLLEAVRRAVPADAACLMRVDGDALVPLAAHGLAPEALGRRYVLTDHPRLDVISRSDTPVLFPPDSPLPDPFDGLVEDDPDALEHIHACMGCPLHVDGELIGVLTVDALDPHAFDEVDIDALSALGALAGAAMRTTHLIEALEESSRRLGLVARDLVRAASERGGGLIGTSAAMERVRQEIALVARTDMPVLITGETGTGKELVARAIHAGSGRADEPLIYVNCAALPESVAESELFGHVRGAFTGAERDRPGKFEVADGGTLLLDEVGELPLSIQAKLLRALQEGEIQRVGADRVLRVDVRVLAATNRDLEREVAAGRIRADLYHRLNVYPLHSPPLRERVTDIALLAGHFCDRARARLGLGPVRLDATARARLRAYAWPGNVRELENVVSRAVLRASAGVTRGDAVVLSSTDLGRDFHVDEVPAAAIEDVPPDGGAAAALTDRVDAFRRREIRRAVDAAGGNWSAAARALGLHRSNLHHLATRLGLR